MNRIIYLAACLAAGLCLTGLGCTRNRPLAPKANVVLIVVDTLGAEYVGSYSGATYTPALDALAAKGVRFERAYSTAPWTKPAVASIFTGKLPSSHGMTSLPGKLGSEQITLAEIFMQNEYQTAGVASHYFLTERFGFAQGFKDFYLETDPKKVHEAITSERVSNRAIEWLRRRAPADKEAPFFLFLHYFDPHYFFQHHADFKLTSDYDGVVKPGLHIRKLRELSGSFTEADLTQLKNLYREEIAYTDFHIGRVLQELKQLGLEQETLVILTADHGEEFMEHGWIGHTRTLYEELIHVPLIVSLPGSIAPAVVAEPVSLVDILPTIADAVALQGVPQEVEGLSLVAALTGKGPAPKRKLFAEVDFKSSLHVKDAYKACIVADSDKLILDKPSATYEQYDLKQDPGEQRNLVAPNTPPQAPLKQGLDSYVAGQQRQNAQPAATPTVPIDAEEIEQLKSLGYM